MKTIDINNRAITPDLTQGWLMPDRVLSAHHEATPAKEGVKHAKVIGETDSGSPIVEYVWDELPHPAMEAWDEYEDVMRFIPYNDPNYAEETAEHDKQLADEVRAERDRLIQEAYWRVERYNTQKALGVPTTDTEDAYKAILEYMEELRNVPQQDGFPRNVKFPQEVK